MVTSLRRYPTQTLVAVVSIAGVLLAVLTVPQAVAENSSDSPSTSVIIDASGSMLAPDAGGQTRMDAAKQATEGLLNDLPKEQRLSLLTYGTQTGSGDEEKPQAVKMSPPWCLWVVIVRRWSPKSKA